MFSHAEDALFLPCWAFCPVGWLCWGAGGEARAWYSAPSQQIYFFFLLPSPLSFSGY